MKTIRDVALDLGLDTFAEDWGINNADPDRLDEFVDYYIQETAQLDHDMQALALELVLASADQAAADSRDADWILRNLRRAVDAVTRPNELTKLALGYWVDYWGTVSRGDVRYQLRQTLMENSEA